MLNGRGNGKNDFTHVSHRGRSVVGYFLVPHEQMVDATSMNVTRMSEIIELFGLNGCEKIPDHSVLVWESTLMLKDCCEIDAQGSQSARKSSNVSKLPNRFMTNTDAILLI